MRHQIHALLLLGDKFCRESSWYCINLVEVTAWGFYFLMEMQQKSMIFTIVLLYTSQEEGI